jgi:hypothetical protein
MRTGTPALSANGTGMTCTCGWTATGYPCFWQSSARLRMAVSWLSASWRNRVVTAAASRSGSTSPPRGERFGHVLAGGSLGEDDRLAVGPADQLPVRGALRLGTGRGLGHGIAPKTWLPDAASTPRDDFRHRAVYMAGRMLGGLDPAPGAVSITEASPGASGGQ